jgi:guanine deaminase
VKPATNLITKTNRQAYRASIFYFNTDPANGEQAYHWYPDGLLVVENGRIVDVGTFDYLITSSAADVKWVDYRDKLLCPGFIDTHIHYSQTDMIASPAKGLLPWLEKYTFASEARFSDIDHAAEVARFFLDELLSCGTTTAMVYCTVHRSSVDAFFAESSARNMRMIAGKVMMDRHCPASLCESAEQSAIDSEALIQKWHGQGRQSYAITPRFAPTSTLAQLQLAGELARTYPDTFIQTHVAENKEECAWAATLFPTARSYLDIYDSFGLMRQRAMYGHCIWLDQGDWQRMHETCSSVAMCPTSNLFLGSGLFDFDTADRADVRLSLATDVGAGTSFSMLRTMDALYKTVKMKGGHLSALRMFYLATLGAARAMGLEGTIGSFAQGAEADFILLDLQATPLLARRTAMTDSLEELLFAFALLGDDRSVYATYIAGSLLHTRR